MTRTDLQILTTANNNIGIPRVGQNALTLLFITGYQAHSKEFSEDAYKRASEPKELYYVAGAGYINLYDRMNLIPFDKLNEFFSSNLK